MACPEHQTKELGHHPENNMEDTVDFRQNRDGFEVDF